MKTYRVDVIICAQVDVNAETFEEANKLAEDVVWAAANHACDDGAFIPALQEAIGAEHIPHGFPLMLRDKVHIVTAEEVGPAE